MKALALPVLAAAAPCLGQSLPGRLYDKLTDGPAAYAQVCARIAAWPEDHPALVRTVGIGASVEGRPLTVLRLGSAPDGAPEVYLGAGTHGHEGSELDALGVVDRLLEGADDPAIAELLRTRVLWVQPLVNPDGLFARQRKNARGVDLNRNFGARWELGEGADSRNHSGPEPFSEPETRALRDFLAGREHLRAYLDLHRSARLLVPAQAGDEGLVDPVVARAAEALDEAAGGLARKEDGRLWHFPTMRGLSIDWVWAELGVVAFTLETTAAGLGGKFDPRWLALLHLLEHAPDYPPGRAEQAAAHDPVLVTDRTRADPAELARLTRPGEVLFRDGFESDASLEAYFELGGRDQGRVRIVTAPGAAHGGTGCLELGSADSDGRSSGASAVLWLGDAGQEVVHLRTWMRYADDYDQGNLHHTGPALAGVAGDNKWRGMGTAGLRPTGDDHFSARVEGWRDWQRLAAPGALQCYVYWMDMRRDRDGHYWGNLLGPMEDRRIVPERGRWHCVEERIAVNTPGQADGELAVWVDGELYLHYQGFRWRSTDAVRLKRATLQAYVHEARRDNRVYYDDLVVSTGYVGPSAPSAGAARDNDGDDGGGRRP